MTTRASRDMWFRMEKRVSENERGRVREYDPVGLGCFECPYADCTWDLSKGLKCRWLKAKEKNELFYGDMRDVSVSCVGGHGR